MGGTLDIEVREEHGVVIAAVTGEIDVSNSAQLRERLFELADNGGTLIVDLNRVAFIDSAGLGALVGTSRRAAERGGSLLAVCAQPQPRKLLWMTGVDKRIPLSATVAGALMFQEASPGWIRSQPRAGLAKRPGSMELGPSRLSDGIIASAGKTPAAAAPAPRIRVSVRYERLGSERRGSTGRRVIRQG